MKIEERYINSSYLDQNPDWDRQDAPWKAEIVQGVLSENKINPTTICEVGCGSGDILINLKKYYPASHMTGFDISPHAAKFWKEHTDSKKGLNNLEFKLGDFHAVNNKAYDVLLMLDVFEHVRDPYTFLEKSANAAKYFIFHIPLDLSASSVLRGWPLMNTRKKVGHLHFYTKDLAIETLLDSGYKIIESKYTGASLNMPNRTLKTRLASIIRRIIYAINKDWGVRLLGGETLIVLATR
ncbi:MAG: SAM-dependent methyltransferase [Psychroserpens sp.]|jgi:SAM-dependent methyltransferase